MIFFYLLVSVMPLTLHPLWGRVVGELTLFKYIGALCIVYAAFHLGARRTFPAYFSTWQARFFAIFYVMATVSYFSRGLALPAPFSPFVRYTCFLFLFFITPAVVDSVRRLHSVLLVAMGSVAFASLYVIREWQKGFAVYGSSFRPGWVVGDPNYFTVSALPCLTTAFYLMLERRPRVERLFCLGCLAVTLVGVTLGASRGGFLGLVAAFLFAVWRSRQRVRNLALASVLVLPLSLASPATPIQRFLHPNPGDKEAEETRITLWEAGLRMIQAHPLGGIGLGNFKFLVGQYETPEEQQRQQTFAHNAYVDIAAEMGVPALLVFLGILYFSYRTLETVRRQTLRSGPPLLHQAARGIQAGLVGTAVGIFFVSSQFEKLFWLMLFLSMCLPSLSSLARPEDRPSTQAAMSPGEGYARREPDYVQSRPQSEALA